VILSGGSGISTIALGEGPAGNILVRAGGSVQILGIAPSSNAPDSELVLSGISSQVGFPSLMLRKEKIL
jgi:hypothetical protein